MAALDYNYMAELVVNAQGGNSDAFAELYAATYQKQYQFAYSYLKDMYLAQDALQETYIIALKELSKLKDPMLLVAWLNQINFRVCFQLHKKQKRYDAEMGGADRGRRIGTGEDLLWFRKRRVFFRDWPQPGGHGGEGGFTGIYYESDPEAAVYGGAGDHSEILQKSEV